MGLMSSSLSGTACLVLLDFLSSSLECEVWGCGGIDAQLVFIIFDFQPQEWEESPLHGNVQPFLVVLSAWRSDYAYILW